MDADVGIGSLGTVATLLFRAENCKSLATPDVDLSHSSDKQNHNSVGRFQLQ